MGPEQNASASYLLLRAEKMVPFPTSDADPGAQGQERKIATYSLHCECRQRKMGRQKMMECGKCKRLFSSQMCKLEIYCYYLAMSCMS